MIIIQTVLSATVRLNPETTETMRTRNGHEVWQVGSEIMTRDEAVYRPKVGLERCHRNGVR